MTSEELHALCKDHIGKPWWPRSLKWETEWAWRLDRSDGHVTSIEAEDMVLGSAMYYLANRAYGEVSVSSPMMGSPTVSFQTDVGKPRRTARDFPCLLAAVLWACEEVSK